MITKAELNKQIDYWRDLAVRQDVEMKTLKAEMDEMKRYSHVNEDMALSLARTNEVIGQMSATIATLAGRR
jgi:hypothetical protein